MRKEFVCIMFILAACRIACAETAVYRCSAYCSCEKCCGKSKDHPLYGITASGKKVREGFVACNHLEFGQVIEIKGLGEFVVEDRGSRKYFGTKENKKLSLDVYKSSHQEALEFGIQYREVIIK